MKSRWLLNLVLLVLVAGIAAFLYLRPKPVEKTEQSFTISNLDPKSFSRLSVEYPAKKPMRFEKHGDRWVMTEPFQGRADLASVGRILSLAMASSKEKQPATDLAKFGLDNPSLKVKIDDHEFRFGMFHPISGDQFVAYGDSVYVLPNLYSESASTQPLEMMDKHILEEDEQIAGFDFSQLEQWESVRLNLDIQKDGKWKVTPEKSKPSQDELNDWFSSNWSNLTANSVEPITLDGKPHPYVTLKLKNGKTLRLIKMQESPELLLVREDHHMQYHFPQDVGFTALNPPVGFRPE